MLTGFEGEVALKDRSEVDVISSEDCDGLRVAIVKEEEVGAEVGEHRTQVAEGGVGDGELAADE